MKEIYRHYGNAKFEINKFNNIKNQNFNKPLGGLYASPLKDVDISWKEWCEREKFRLDKLNKYFDFRLRDNAKVLTLKTKDDLVKLPRLKISYEVNETVHKYNFDIDFEKIAEEFDAIMVCMYRSPIENFRDSLYWQLYGWDCDTLLVCNPNIIDLI